MKRFRIGIACTLLVTFGVSACASSTLIRSVPSGAKIYLNGEPVGRTPYTMTDTKMVGSTTQVTLEATGYERFDTVITRNEEFDVGACIGGVLLLVPFLWIQKYKPLHTYEMTPTGGPPPPPPVATPGPVAPAPGS